MVAPLNAVMVVHNAFRRDLTEIDQAVYKVASHGGDLSPLIDRLQYLSDILDRHEKGEEHAVFPEVDRVAPLLSPLFVDDHREMSKGLGKVVDAPDELAAARASAVLHTQVRIHLAKEDAFLYPALRERIDLEEQADIVGQLWGRSFPPDDVLPQYMNWLYGLVNQEDQATITIVWKQLMTEKVFAVCTPLIREAVTTDDWSELTRRVPGMT
ncbi:MAG: hemerythrin domain-containing protein [Gammaproteobacteria bacterium]|nr:hemerythrin domain-containing protein [Gammaproteobacteria bacterium]